MLRACKDTRIRHRRQSSACPLAACHADHSPPSFAAHLCPDRSYETWNLPFAGDMQSAVDDKAVYVIVSGPLHRLFL